MQEIRLFRGLREARFISRPNRFTVFCEVDGQTVKAHLPNSGRMRELLIPDARLLVHYAAAPTRSTAWTVDAVFRDHYPVVLRTDRSNAVTQALLEQRLVPGLEDAEVVATEVTHGASRFDFLLHRGGRDLMLEVKSCTLFEGEVAMFPDAVTARGAKHVRELTGLAKEGTPAAVIYLVQSPTPLHFLPDLHTDLEFTRAFLDSRDHVMNLPLAIEWGPDLEVARPPRLLDIPWDLIEREAEDRGTYVLLLRLDAEHELEFGHGRRHRFSAGWYAYVGSAMRGLSQRMARHVRSTKRPHWHIDALRAVSRVAGHVLVRSADRLECPLAAALSSVADFTVAGFGASDCRCPSHLFGFTSDPLHRRTVHDILGYFKMARLGPALARGLPGR